MCIHTCIRDTYNSWTIELAHTIRSAIILIFLYSDTLRVQMRTEVKNSNFLSRVYPAFSPVFIFRGWIHFVDFATFTKEDNSLRIPVCISVYRIPLKKGSDLKVKNLLLIKVNPIRKEKQNVFDLVASLASISVSLNFSAKYSRSAWQVAVDVTRLLVSYPGWSEIIITPGVSGRALWQTPIDHARSVHIIAYKSNNELSETFSAVKL